jgi:hypothetical protein
LKDRSLKYSAILEIVSPGLAARGARGPLQKWPLERSRRSLETMTPEERKARAKKAAAASAKVRAKKAGRK